MTENVGILKVDEFYLSKLENSKLKIELEQSRVQMAALQVEYTQSVQEIIRLNSRINLPIFEKERQNAIDSIFEKACVTRENYIFNERSNTFEKLNK